mgnify:CR=1 FL=1
MKEFGFFKELNLDAEIEYPSIESAQIGSGEPLQSRAKVIKYLENGFGLIATASLVFDPFQKNRKVICPFNVRTDGDWCWPSELPYLIKEYHVRIPDEFRQKMRARVWIPPSEKELDLDILLEAYDRLWEERMRQNL